jgi:two-component system, response regulator
MKGTEIEIILVEDNVDDAGLALMALSKHNLSNKILHLKNGDEAIKFIFEDAEFEGLRFSGHPKVILLDLKMPKVDGMEVLKRVKGDPATKSIPVVILTSSAEDPDIKKCYDLGANSYIVKPIEFENFSVVVAELGFYWAVLNK